MKRAIFLLALGVPTSVAAQTGNTTISTFVASDGGVSSGPVLVGLNATREQGWTAIRVGGAVDAGSTLLGSEPAAGSVSVISGDVDAMVYLGRPSPTRVVNPYVFAGVGGRMLSGANANSALTWGYGAGARTPLGDRLSLEGELRYREPLTELSADAGQSAGLEYRFGVSVRFGRSPSRAPSAPRIPTTTFPRSVSFPTTTASSAPSAAARRRVAEQALDLADDYVGVPYTWGGNTPQEGFDCSGFVKFVFARQGISLPRVSRDQASTGTPIPLDVSALEPGDLIAFASDGNVVDHIGIYAGNGRFIHSSSSGNGVRFDDLYSQRGNWYLTHMVAARRVIDAGSTFASN